VTLRQQRLQRQSRQQRAAQTREDGSDSGFMDDVVNWFKHTTKNAKPSKQESNSSERIRKALGGK